MASASSSSCHSSNEIDDEDARTNSEDWKGTRRLLLLLWLLPNWMINAIQKNNQIHSDLGAVLRTYYLPTYLKSIEASRGMPFLTLTISFFNVPFSASFSLDF